MYYRYREAGAEVIEVLSRFSNCVEIASIDESYIDLTEAVTDRLAEMESKPVLSSQLPNSHIVGWDGNTDEESSKEGNYDSARGSG